MRRRNNMDETLLTTVEENFEDTPDEVTDFIFGDEFNTVKEEFSKYLEKDEEKIGLSNMLKLFLFGAKTIDELSDYIDKLSTTDEKKGLIKKTVQEKVIDELLLLIEVHEEMDKKVDTNTDTAKIINPLTSLSDRLKQASIATPTKRDYINKTPSAPEINNITNTPTRATIDPYHEPVDNG